MPCVLNSYCYRDQDEGSKYDFVNLHCNTFSFFPQALVFTVYVFGLLDWFPYRLRDVDGSHLNLTETVLQSNSRDIYWGGYV